MEDAKNRWMILKRHIQGRGNKSFPELMEIVNKKYFINWLLLLSFIIIILFMSDSVYFDLGTEEVFIREMEK